MVITIKIKFNLTRLAGKWQAEKGERLTMLEISAKTGIRYQTIINYRDNKMKIISIKNLAALLAFFGCSVDELLILEDGKNG